jgi:hypothetical protein
MDWANSNFLLPEVVECFNLDLQNLFAYSTALLSVEAWFVTDKVDEILPASSLSAPLHDRPSVGP